MLGGYLHAIATPDAASLSEVRRQAEGVDRETLPVGAADFFAALLDLRAARKELRVPSLPAPGPTLVVCGSAASWPLRQNEAQVLQIPNFAWPHDSIAIARAVQSSGRAVLGIGGSPGQTPAALAMQMAQTVAAVLQGTPVARLMIEGGATAAAILQALGWTRLSAIDTLGDVAVLHRAGAIGPGLFIKPGSYDWPPALWPGN